MNIPNKLTIFRIILIPVIIAVFYIPYIPYRFLCCAVIFLVASITDFLDGYIARKYNMVTDFGKFFDPIADKILVLTSFVLILTMPSILGRNLGYDFYMLAGGIGVSVIVAREMLVSAIRMVASSKGKVLPAEKVGKVKTFVTDIAIILLFASRSMNFTPIYYAGVVMYLIAIALTIYSGVFYMVKNKDLFSNGI